MKIICLKVQLLIALLEITLICSDGTDHIHLDRAQEYEMFELEANIDPETGVRRYDNYQLLRIQPSTEEHVNILQFLEKGLVDIWNPISRNVSLIDHADLMVAPKHAGHVKNYLKCSGMKIQVISENLQRQIDEENIVHDNKETTVTKPGNCLHEANLDFKNYHAVSTFHKYLECLDREHHDKVNVFDIGRSTEGRPLKVIKIGTKASDGRVKPAIWIDGGIHAREWVSPATVLYLVHQLVENFGASENRFIVEQLDIYILPSANPDGYEYSRLRNRMWRKTRSNTGSSCIGVDPNRNWGYKWGGKGASENPCSSTYRGKFAFSEPETRAIKDFILVTQRSQDIKMYLTFHSYGQYILYPWGYAAIDTHDRRDLHNMGQVGAQAIQRVNSRRRYKVGHSAKLLYPAAGASDDWAKGGAGIKYSYTVELPDNGAYGFLLPSNRIEGVGRETHAGVIAMFKRLLLERQDT